MTSNAPNTYECQLHAKIHAGTKREDFNKEFYAKVLDAPMNYSMRIYKDVKFGCHCPENYKVFDTIVSEMSCGLKSLAG